MNSKRKLSIITVVDRNLSGLIAIHSQIKNFLCDQVEWVIKDSSRCHDTKKWGQSVSNKNIKFISSNDSGLYEALNQAISVSTGSFYVVLGSDDSIFPESLAYFLNNYIKFCCFDIMVFPVVVNGKIKFINKYSPIFLGTASIVSSHSVGTFIKKSIHQEIGFYDESYKILADSLFLTKAFRNNFKFCYIQSDPVGEFGTNGISSINLKVRFYEAYRYQKDLGSSKFLQVLLLILRIFKYSPILIRRYINNI